MITVEIPDKQATIDFPDGTPPATIESVIKSQFYGGGTPSPQPMQAQAPYSPPADPMSESLGMFSPSAVGQAALQEAPAIAGMVASAAAKAPTGISAPLFGMGAAAGGLVKRGMTGESGKDVVTPEMQTLMDAGLPTVSSQTLNDFMVGTGAGVLGDSIMGVIKKAGAPFVKAMDKAITASATAKAAKELADQGLPISVETYAPSKTAKVFQWAADNIFPMNKLVQARRGDLVQGITQMRQDFVQDILKLPDPSMPAKDAAQYTKDRFAEWITKMGGNEAKVPVMNLKAKMDELMADPLISTSKWAQENLVPISGKLATATEISVKDLNQIMASIGSEWGGKGIRKGLSKEFSAMKDDVIAAIKNDVGAFDASGTGELLGALNKARKSAGFQYQLRQSKQIESLLNRYTQWDGEAQKYLFDAGKFAADAHKNKNAWERAFPQQYDNLMAFAEKMRAVSLDYGKFVQGKKTETMADVAQGLSMAGATIMKPWVAVPLGFEAFVAHSISSPSGLVRKWLSSGVAPPAMLGPALKVGGLKVGEVFDVGIPGLEGERE